MATPRTVYTVGHSNTPVEEFLDLLTAHGIRALADVRSYPRSRRHPHFGGEALAGRLEKLGIDYRWFPELGGRRKPVQQSRHPAWQVAAFRAYADYMDTANFGAAVAELLSWTGERRTALLCAERLWWQCHRRLLSDHLVVDGHQIHHILAADKLEPHRLTEFLRIEKGQLHYDMVLPLGN